MAPASRHGRGLHGHTGGLRGSGEYVQVSILAASVDPARDLAYYVINALQQGGGPPADVPELAIMEAVQQPNLWLSNAAAYSISNSEQLAVSLRAAFRGCPIHVELLTVDTWRQELEGPAAVATRVAASHVVILTPGVAA